MADETGSEYPIAEEPAAVDSELNEPLADEVEEEDEPGWKRWLPWIVVAIVILLVAWLIWLYSDYKKGGETEKVSRSSVVVVPNVVGLTEDEARVALAAVGLTPRVEVSYDVVAPAGTVSDQSIGAGSRVAKGTVVAISVVPVEERTESKQREDVRKAQEVPGTSPKPEQLPTPRMLPVPKLVGLSESAARTKIKNAGFEPRVMYQPRSSSIGTVYQQSPDPGQKVPEGRFVYVLVGSMD